MVSLTIPAVELSALDLSKEKNWTVAYGSLAIWISDLLFFCFMECLN